MLLLLLGMKTQLTPKKVSYLLLGSLMAMSIACVNQVETPDDDGSGGSGGSGGDTTSSANGGAGGTGAGNSVGGSGQGGSGQGGAAPEADGIAIRLGDIPPPMSTTSSGGTTVSTTTGGGPTPDPNTLRLILGDELASCSDPTAGTDCGGHWRVSITVPPSMQQPGVYSLEDLNGFFSVSGELEPGGICSGGGGTFWDGTVEIVSIDNAGLDVVLSNTMTFDFDANGSHYLSRCPSAP